MTLAKAIVIFVVTAVILTGVLFAFVPATRPAPVKKWIYQARGYGPATSADDCLEKLKKALEKRDYDAARLYFVGDYVEFLERGGPDAAELAKAVDELRDVMKTTGVKSDKVDFMLFKLDPFPPFKVVSVKANNKGGADAVLNWELPRVENAPSIDEYRVNRLLMHSLLPFGVLGQVTVPVRDTGAGWKVEWPVAVGDRHMRDCVEALRKSATNYRNGIRDVKQNLKNNPGTKDQFEREFKTALEQSN